MSPESRDKPFLDEQVRLAGRQKYLWQRARMVHAIRLFFIERHYLELETPQLIPAPAPEAHIEAVKAGDLYLHTSPEICMKRLLSAGFTKIFQISKCFRNGERGNHHLPEFTLLEWYRTGIDYKSLMEECKALLLSVSESLGLGGKLHYQGMEIELECDWEKISVSEAFDRYGSLSLPMALEKGCFDQVMVREIEPHLGVTRPAFLYDYPATLAALSRLKSDDPGFAERFELYIGSIELANGFSELTDPREQRSRFERARQRNHDMGKQVYPMPEKFLKSLEYMPEASGIALGVDRLAMIFTNRARIDDVVSFTPEEL